jgi:hypothetical protein
MLKKMSMKIEKEEPAVTPVPQPVPRTGLNYVELAYDKYNVRAKRKGQTGTF